LPDTGIPTDAMLKRSFDGGKTWQTEQILFPAENCNYHSAMAVADNQSDPNLLNACGWRRLMTGRCAFRTGLTRDLEPGNN